MNELWCFTTSDLSSATVASRCVEMDSSRASRDARVSLATAVRQNAAASNVSESNADKLCLDPPPASVHPPGR
jgi:hypothetical protein